jgi:hypothetical protein
MGSKVGRGSPGRDDAPVVRQLIVFLGMAFFHLLSGFAAAPGRALPASDELRSLSIDGYYDPERNFLNATAKLNFASTAGERRLWLAEGLDLKSVRSVAQPAVSFRRDNGQFLVLGPGEKDLELTYSGRLERQTDPFASAAGQESGTEPVPVDDYRFLSYIKDFYPNPRIDFTPLSMKFSVPKDWNCLGSGKLCSVQSEQATNTYQFDNSEAKGMALVCGRFTQVGFVDGAIPLKLHGGDGFKFERYFSAADMAGVISFFRERFGPLHVQELNVLFRRGSSFGGVSYNGLIVLNVDESWASRTAKERNEQRRGSPLSLIDAKFDLLAHEMSHQWWGGLISWKAPADNWITEGLATYSTLLLLRERQGEKAYRQALSHLKRWVKKYGAKGACADGFKLKLWNRDLRVYQTLVYVKPALMLAELADAIGEGELCLRLQGILKERRCCNVDTEEFLRLLSAGDESRQARLAEWVRGRGLPESR